MPQFSPPQKGNLRVQGSAGGSAGARKKPSWQGQAAAAAGEGRVWGGQGWQLLRDTVALKEPGGQAGGAHTHNDTGETPNTPSLPTASSSRWVWGGGGVSHTHPPSTHSGYFRVFHLIFVASLLLGPHPSSPISWLRPAMLAALVMLKGDHPGQGVLVLPPHSSNPEQGF